MTKIRMAEILEASTYDLANGYVPGTCGGRHAAAIAWTRVCSGLTCVSAGVDLRDGYVRYDQPGSIAPMQRAEICFVPASLSRSSKDYMRRHARKMYVVTAAPHPDTLAAEAEKAKAAEEAHISHCSCDNGHKWQSDDRCPTDECPVCGEGWV